LLDSGYVDSLGVCDLDKNILEKLYEWARVRNTKLCTICLQMTSLIFLLVTCVVLPIIHDSFSVVLYSFLTVYIVSITIFKITKKCIFLL